MLTSIFFYVINLFETALSLACKELNDTIMIVFNPIIIFLSNTPIDLKVKTFC